MRCFLDMDGVLVNFIEGVYHKHGLHGFYDKPENLGSWDIDKRSGLSGNDFWGSLDREFWANLNWMPDGRDILNWLESKYGIHNICLLTAPQKLNRTNCIAGKFDWIERHIPDYANQVLVGSFKEIMGHEGAILIDDYYKNCDAFASRGGHTFLVPRKWNRLYQNAHETLDYMKQHLAKR